MLGRAAYQNPWILAELSRSLGWPAAESREAVVEAMVGYARRHIDAGGRLNHVARHMLGLFHGQPGARHWRRHLSQNMHLDGAEPELLSEAMGGCDRLAAEPTL
jgi:tRNA-dihydrouridine synthase A